MLWWLLGCSSCAGLPETVPAGAGKITEADAPDLLTASSPDLQVIPWLAITQLVNEDYRDCPLVHIQDSVISFDAGGEVGCLDSAGVSWRGTAAVSYGASEDIVFSFEDFGPVDGVPAPWSAFGTLIVGVTEAGAGMRVTSRLELTSYHEDGTKQFWNETKGGFAFHDGVFYADHVYGLVGVGDWGTADVDINRVPLSLVNGCSFGAHASGTTALFAKNDGVFFFTLAEEASIAPPPTHAHDSGGGGGDTGPSGGGGGGDGMVLPSPLGDAGGLCGECAGFTIDSEGVEGCVAPGRSMSWPFYAPF
jgi:hypothetical protein